MRRFNLNDELFAFASSPLGARGESTWTCSALRSEERIEVRGTRLAPKLIEAPLRFSSIARLPPHPGPLPEGEREKS
jgi:hypothetical protein